MRSPRCVLGGALAAISLASTAPAQISFTNFVELPGTSLLTESVLPIDENGDGDLDFVYGTAGVDQHVSWGENTGPGFGHPQLLDGFSGADAAVDLESGDLDGDGLPDVVAVLRDSGSLVVLLNDPSFGMSFHPAVSVSSGITSQHDVELADIDSDGDLDIIAVNAATTGTCSEVRFHENDGTGAFLPGATLFANGCSALSSVELADLDADGDVDLALTDSGQSRLLVISNLGSGSYSAPAVVSTGLAGASHVAVGDFDGDGSPDLAVTSPGDGRVSIFRNNGDATFGGLQPAAAGLAEPEGVLAEDLDLDGDVDLVAYETRACAGSNRVLLIPNAVSGFFDPPIALSSPVRQIRQLRVADMDGDAAPDLVVDGSRPFSTTCWHSALIAYNTSSFGTVQCTSNANSTGSVAGIRASGSDLVALGKLGVTASSVPAGSFGYMLASRTPGQVMNPAGSEGVLCLAGQIGRFVGPGQVQQGGPLGRIRIQVDLDQVPSPIGFVSMSAGEHWYFQAWFRDTVGGAATSNFSDSVEVAFR